MNNEKYLSMPYSEYLDKQRKARLSKEVIEDLLFHCQGRVFSHGFKENLRKCGISEDRINGTFYLKDSNGN